MGKEKGTLASVIEKIIAHKRKEVAMRAAAVPLAKLERAASSARPIRDLITSLSQPGVAIIAEVKCKSPSRGVMVDRFDPIKLAEIYSSGGAAAISVLADETFFGVGVPVVAAIAKHSLVKVPILYKDFILTPYQIVEARAVGADAVLIVTRALSSAELHSFLDLSNALGLAAIVEVFNEVDLAYAVDAGAQIIGINNRDLDTFRVDPNRAQSMRARLPRDVIAIAESGFYSGADVMRARQAGFAAALIGESLVTSPNPAAKLAEFVNAARAAIC